MVALTRPERPYGGYSTGTLLREVAENVRALVSHEASALSIEVKTEVAHARRAAMLAATGGALVLVGGIVLAIAISELLALALPHWAGYAIVGGVITIAGVVALLVGRKKAADVSAIPHHTLESAKRDARWIKDETTSTIRSSRRAAS